LEHTDSKGFVRRPTLVLLNAAILVIVSWHFLATSGQSVVERVRIKRVRIRPNLARFATFRGFRIRAWYVEAAPVNRRPSGTATIKVGSEIVIECKDGLDSVTQVLFPVVGWRHDAGR